VATDFHQYWIAPAPAGSLSVAGYHPANAALSYFVPGTCVSIPSEPSETSRLPSAASFGYRSNK